MPSTDKLLAGLLLTQIEKGDVYLDENVEERLKDLAWEEINR